ncbi:MAG TPA: esterase-like activity of phytase family protein [Candidatus Limnocylindria bacterium]|nr:esterase-like activity of phytase family protein [Candidatus Limnocylindria bacterium]
MAVVAQSGPPDFRPIVTEPGCTSYTLTVERRWALQSANGERFDASGLNRLADGRLVTVNDKDTGVFEVDLGPGEVASLRRIPGVLDRASLQKLCPGRTLPFDLEALAVDSTGRLYVTDEAERLVFRYDFGTRTVDRLAIDWSPVTKWFNAADRNASFEGVAAGDGKLFVANEREVGRIIELDAGSLQITRDFQVRPPGVTSTDVHYSDLAWHDHELWILCREHRQVLAYNPATQKLRAAFGYKDIELDSEYAYRHLLPYGFFEGLYIDDTYIWLCIDNNGYPRRSDEKDSRPQIIRCRRPDRAEGKKGT